MKYPDHKTYETLYAKYINKQNLLDMMNLAGKNYSGKNFMDICCGNGDATIEAFNRGASYCCLIDQEPDMIPKNLQRINVKKRHYYNYSAKDALHIYHCNSGNKIDIAFCRQGVNYWLDYRSIENLANVMSEKGVFIFNTFNTKPAREPMIKEYKIDAVFFVEISYLVGDDTVHHVQIREGYPPHITEFKWLSEEYIKSCLTDFFDYKIIRKNKTDIYKCVKKK